jgi:hypothetical protein
MCPGAGKKKYVSENMQDQIPIAYAIWKILIILVMTILCIVCIRQINVYVNMQKLKKKNICTANLFKQLFLLVAAITRWLWLLDPHYNSRIWPAPLFGTKHKTYAAVTLVLITLPQIFYLIVLNLEIQQWRSVIHKTNKLESIRRSKTGINCCKLSARLLSYFSTFPLVVMLGFIAICTIISDEEGQACVSLWGIYSITFLFYMLVWSVAGLYYAFKLNKMITLLRSFKIRKNNRNASVSQKYKALHKLSRIRQTVIALTIIGLSNLTNQIISNFVIDICCDKKDQLKENYFYLIKISIIHFGEAVILERLLNTIRTIDYEQKTFKNKEVDTLQSNASVKTDISSEMINLELTTHSNLSTSNADISIYEENDHVKLMKKNKSENNKNKNSWASLQRE